MAHAQPRRPITRELSSRAVPGPSSVLEENALLERVVQQYAIGRADSCRFVDRGDADIYRVRTAEDTFYLKIYRPPNTREQAETEARFVERLADEGLQVVRAVRRTDGAFASEASPMRVRGRSFSSRRHPRPCIAFRSPSR